MDVFYPRKETDRMISQHANLNLVSFLVCSIGIYPQICIRLLIQLMFNMYKLREGNFEFEHICRTLYWLSKQFNAHV